METASNTPANTPSWARENFAAITATDGGSFGAVRVKAFERFCALGLPTTALEEWRYTNVAPIGKKRFRLAPAQAVGPEILAPYIPADLAPHRLVFVNGAFAPTLSDTSGLAAGLAVGSLRSAWTGNGSAALAPLVEANLARHAAFDEHPFVALNTALVTDGAVVRVARGTVVEKPIHIIHVSTASLDEVVTAPRVLVVVEENSVATVLESFVTVGAGGALTTAVTEIVAGENAEVHHYRVQEESTDSYHFSTVQIASAARARVRTAAFSFGGRLVRNEVNAVMKGAECFTGMFGLTVIGGEQHVDNHTVLDHAEPRCESRELYKGIYADSSSGVFNGTIIVRPDAQKTNAFQSNRALLLSEEASIDSKPQLKIWADDVKCTHGATVGQLDEAGLFYLRSRGIPFTAARAMLIHAFASEVVSEIGLRPLKGYLESRLLEKLGGSAAA